MARATPGDVVNAPVEPVWRPVSPELARLAEAHGVAIDYWDQSGKHVDVGAATVEAVLAALGVDTSTPEALSAALADLHLRPWRRTLPPVYVATAGTAGWVWVHLPHGTSTQVHVELEDGGRRDLGQVDHLVEPQWIDGRLVGEATFEIPGDLPLGWHRLVADTEDGTADCPLVVAPARLDPPGLAQGRQWGFMTQLYSVRSRRSWGLGDLADLADLAAWSGHDLGAGFVLVNPLHAASPVPPMAPSPYLPVTRRFANPLYLRVEAIPEFAYLPAKDRGQVRRLGRPLRAASRTADLLDRDASWAAKLEALALVHDVRRTPGRQAAYDGFREREGEGLVAFGTWCALVEEYGPSSSDWPEDLQSPDGAGVAAARHRLAPRIEFHCWLQWCLDEQLADAQRAAVEAGMPIGVMHDLAVGVHPEGADAWALQSVLATGVSVGAPPDMYNQMGQDWSQPPWRPDALAEAGFVPYRDMLRTVLRHAGGLRIDHVLGLFRMWWIPRGMPAYAGTYVRCDHQALLGVLLLEAHRAGALVIGEDLGTVEPWVQDVLRDRGILGTSIVWFERWESGLIRRPEQWRRQAMASVTVHDLPPTAGYLRGEHVRIRADLGLLSHSLEEEHAAAAREWQEWSDLLREYDLLPAEPGDDPEAALETAMLALHRLVASSPSVLVGVALPDAVGDRRAQNQPGTDQEYPNWRVPLCDSAGDPVLLDDLPGMPLLQNLVEASTAEGA